MPPVITHPTLSSHSSRRRARAMATASALSSAHARVRAGVAATRATARPRSRTPSIGAPRRFLLPERRFARARGTTRLAVASSDAATTDLFGEAPTRTASHVASVVRRGAPGVRLRRARCDLDRGVRDRVRRHPGRPGSRLLREDAHARSKPCCSQRLLPTLENGGVDGDAAMVSRPRRRPCFASCRRRRAQPTSNAFERRASCGERATWCSTRALDGLEEGPRGRAAVRSGRTGTSRTRRSPSQRRTTSSTRTRSRSTRACQERVRRSRRDCAF